MDERSTGEKAQLVLADLLTNPRQSVRGTVKQLFSENDLREQQKIASVARGIVKNVLGLKTLADVRGSEDPPGLIERLRFCWVILQKTEARIKKMPPSDIPSQGRFGHIRTALSGLLSTKRTEVQLHTCLLVEICKQLRIDGDAGFLARYNDFLRIVKPRPLGLHILSTSREPVPTNIRRLIWWIIRRRKDKYVEVPREGPPTVHFTYLPGEILDHLCDWSVPEVRSVPDIGEEIENVLNEWLGYSCLDGDSVPDDLDTHRALAGAFLKDNKLTTDVKLAADRNEISPAGGEAKMIRELKNELERYAEENSALESENRILKDRLAKGKMKAQEKSQSPLDSLQGFSRELSELAITIDSKYTLDVLHSIQLGEEPTFSMRNLVAHFLYAFRKKGLIQYPSEASFDLQYEDSRLFDCTDFEVKPSQLVKVSVVRKGWYIRQGKALVPVRRATVRLSE